MTEMLGTIFRPTDGEVAIRFERHYDTDPADLWESVTKADRLARWFAPIEGELSPGGGFAILFEDNHVPGCVVESCDAPRSFSWSWPQTEGPGLITVTVAADPAGGSLLTLVHTGLVAHSAPEYGAGWQGYVLALEAFVAGAEKRDWWTDFGDAKGAYAAALS
jgi:uncharacterized protein YndB with AHSA1/START domain